MQAQWSSAHRLISWFIESTMPTLTVELRRGTGLAMLFTVARIACACTTCRAAVVRAETMSMEYLVQHGQGATVHHV